MARDCPKRKLTLVIGGTFLLIGFAYGATALEVWVGSSDHIGLWNGPSTLTARTLKTPIGETTGAWHYHPGFVYNVVRQGTITVEDGCGNVQSFSMGQAFETSHRAIGQRPANHAIEQLRRVTLRTREAVREQIIRRELRQFTIDPVTGPE